MVAAVLKPHLSAISMRLAAIQAVEDRFLAAPPERHLALHTGLMFYRLLTDNERSLLVRRFPNELATDPNSADANDGTRLTWDSRSRELIVDMLQFGARATAAGMELVRQLEPGQDVAAFAMTASGSFVALERPALDGWRRLVYCTSVRPGGCLDEGTVLLDEPLKVGKAAQLGSRRTSSLLMLAIGPALPSLPESPAAMLLGSPAAGVATEVEDPFDIGLARLRSAVEGSEKATGEVRRLLQEKAAALACALQRQLEPEGGFQLKELASFDTGSGSRYQVMQHGALDLVRRNADELACVWMHEADIGPQSVVIGAPLVLFYSGALAARRVAFVFRVARVKPL